MNKYKNGFTLVELLIVMVIVAILIVIALPQYKVAMEKGRAMEGVHNAQAMSEAANVAYIKNYNVYPANIDENLYAGTKLEKKDGKLVSKFFTVSATKKSDSELEVQVTRTGVREGNGYTISFTNQNGEVTSRSCTGNTRYCKAINLPVK